MTFSVVLGDDLKKHFIQHFIDIARVHGRKLEILDFFSKLTFKLIYNVQIAFSSTLEW